MSTLTVYFASSSELPSSSSTTTTAVVTPATTANIPIPPTRIIQNSTKPILIPSPSPPSITLPSLASPVQTPPSSRRSSKRNKTFFERFTEVSPSALISNPLSPSSIQRPSIDLSNSSLDPAPRLRRRFTFRRSLRHSVHNKGGDIDDGTRSVLSFPFFLKFS